MNMPADNSTSPSIGSPRVRIPVIREFVLNNITLYEEKPRIDLQFSPGVFCLAGANGLGKSTFLAMLGFSITGIVANPQQKFASLSEYYESSLGFSDEYFTGRINAADRDQAEATISFQIGPTEYQLTRGMFESTGLRSLQVRNDEGPVIAKAATTDREKLDLHEEYKTQLARDMGLASFDQIVFLYHFLLSFDERRHLLFWDPDVARQALYLSFGVDADAAKDADTWQRQADRLESQARQAQYQATTALQRINELKRRGEGLEPLDDSIVEEHENLTLATQAAELALEQKQRNNEDSRLAHAHTAADHHRLVRDYERLFSEVFDSSPDPSSHPVVRALMETSRCQVCGTSGDELASAVRQQIEAHHCPLCSSALGTRDSADSEKFSQLERQDAAIADAHRSLSEAAANAARIEAETQAAEIAYRTAVDALATFEAKHEEVVITSEADPVALGPIIRQLEAERENAQQRRDNFRRRRNEFRAKLAPVQENSTHRYQAAVPVFVPRFQELAREFLGLDLHVDMEQRSRGAELVLTINGARRRRTTQLSESQRYFVDIALRMALTEYMVGPDNAASLYVDTPEGSLDVAYEVRAGRMFGSFVKSGSQLIMTANINSSRLVQRLAEVCGRELMHIERMTDWTALSEVQAEGEGLFDEAFENLQNALGQGHK